MRLTKSMPVALLLGLATNVLAAAPAPQQAPEEVAKMRALVSKDCDGCHTRRFGDAAAAYTRSDRRVHTPAQLRAQIAYCNSELGAGLFPDEEEHVAIYLNLLYYKFGQ